MNLVKHLEKPEGAKSWVFLGCSHAPLQNKKALKVCADRIAELAPDYVIHGGDLHEMDSASKWPSEYSWTLEDEYKEANFEVLKPLRLSNPNKKAKYILLPGNHDANLTEVGRVNPKLRSLLQWDAPQYTKGSNRNKPVWLNEELLTKWDVACDYDYSRKGGVFRIGATSFFHGYECGGQSDAAQAITLGWPYGLAVSVHTHRPTPGEPKQAMKGPTLPLPFFYLNAGCTRDMECNFMKRKRQAMWGHALCYGWSMPINSPRMSKTWQAYCELIAPFE